IKFDVGGTGITGTLTLQGYETQPRVLTGPDGNGAGSILIPGDRNPQLISVVHVVKVNAPTPLTWKVPTMGSGLERSAAALEHVIDTLFGNKMLPALRNSLKKALNGPGVGPQPKGDPDGGGTDAPFEAGNQGDPGDAGDQAGSLF